MIFLDKYMINPLEMGYLYNTGIVNCSVFTVNITGKKEHIFRNFSKRERFRKLQENRENLISTFSEAQCK